MNTTNENVHVENVSVVSVVQPVAEPTLYDTHIKENFHVFGVASILYACLYTFCMYKNESGITYPVFVLGSLGLIYFFQKKLELQWKKESVFYSVSMILLGISTCCTDDWRIIFLNKIGVNLLMICMVLGIVYDTRKWEPLVAITMVSVLSLMYIVFSFSHPDY